MRRPEDPSVVTLRFIAILFLILISDVVGLWFNKTSMMELICDLLICGFCIGGLLRIRSEVEGG